MRFWNGNGYGIFFNLRDIVGLHTVVYEMGEGKESNGAKCLRWRAESSSGPVAGEFLACLIARKTSKVVK